MARGHRLNTSIVLAAIRGLSGLFRAVSAVEPSLIRPPPPHLLPPPSRPSPSRPSPSLISHLASVDVKQYGQRGALGPVTKAAELRSEKTKTKQKGVCKNVQNSSRFVSGILVCVLTTSLQRLQS